MMVVTRSTMASIPRTMAWAMAGLASRSELVRGFILLIRCGGSNRLEVTKVTDFNATLCLGIGRNTVHSSRLRCVSSAGGSLPAALHQWKHGQPIRPRVLAETCNDNHATFARFDLHATMFSSDSNRLARATAPILASLYGGAFVSQAVRTPKSNSALLSQTEFVTAALIIGCRVKQPTADLVSAAPARPRQNVLPCNP